MNNNENIEMLDERRAQPTKQELKTRRKSSIVRLKFILGFLVIGIVVALTLWISQNIKFEEAKDATLNTDEFKIQYSSKTFSPGMGGRFLLEYKQGGEVILEQLANLSDSGVKIVSKADRMAAYNSFITLWSNDTDISGSGELLPLKDNMYYATVDYKLNGLIRGKIYAIYSQNDDLFVTIKCSASTIEKVDLLNKDTLSIIKTLIFN